MDQTTAEKLLAELKAIRKAVSAKAGRPHLIVVRALVVGRGWDVRTAYDLTIDANRITKIEPFSFWSGLDAGDPAGANVPGCLIHSIGSDRVYSLMTPEAVRALADA